MSILLRRGSPRSISVFGIVVSPRVAQWIARFWISAVIVGSLLPASEKAKLHTNEGPPGQHDSEANTKHRFIHFLAFGSSFVVLSLLATGRREQLEAAGEVMLIGCIVEVIQYFAYSHQQLFEWWDVRDDAIGIAVAFVLVRIAGRANE